MESYGLELTHFAIQDWKLNEKRKQELQMINFSGHLSCFCQNEATKGVPSNMTYGAEKLRICEQMGDLGLLQIGVD